MTDVRTQPDWFSIRRLNAGSITNDAGEIAARLGSPVTFDRRGDVLFADSFEHGIAAYNIGSVPSGGTAQVSIERARTGGFSYKVTLDGVGADSFTISKTLYGVVTNRIGFECHIALSPNGDHVELNINVTKNGLTYFGNFIIDQNNSILVVGADGLGNVTVGTWTALGMLDTAFVPVKLVIDVDESKYVRAMFGSQEIDLSAYSIPSSVFNPEGMIHTSIDLETDNGEAKTYYIDDWIVTQNEP